jgi:hypothetical protein
MGETAFSINAGPREYQEILQPVGSRKLDAVKLQFQKMLDAKKSEKAAK